MIILYFRIKWKLKKMLPKCQKAISDFIIFLLVMLKNLVPHVLDGEKLLLLYENLQVYLRLGLKLKKNTSCIRIQSMQMAKTICQI